MTKTKINVSGMHCKSCEMLIDDALTELDGVNSVKSSHEEGTVSVDFDDKKINLTKIKSVIKDEGYELI